jgi:hypothetical protein
MAKYTVRIVMTSSDGNRYEIDTQVIARDEQGAKAIAAETVRLNNHGYSVLAKTAFFDGFVPETAKAAG